MEDEIIQEAEVISHWSKQRILIAVLLFVLIIGGGVVGIKYLINNSKQVLGVNSNSRPSLQLPDQKKIQDVLDSAQEELSKINPEDMVKSQPKIQKIISDLEHITNSSNSAKSLICDSICK